MHKFHSPLMNNVRVQVVVNCTPWPGRLEGAYNAVDEFYM